MTLVIKILIILCYILLFLLGYWLHHRGLKAVYTRKIVHIGSGLNTLLLPWYFTQVQILFIAVLFTAILANVSIVGFFDFLKVKSQGNTGVWGFPAGLLISALFFLPFGNEFFLVGVLVISLADGLGGIAGYCWGKREYYFISHKTYLGSLVFFTVTLLIFFSFLWWVGLWSPASAASALIGSFFLTVVEGLLGKGYDNLFIPVLASWLAYGLVNFFL